MLHAATRAAYGAFEYLEIGSHLGASLQSFVADPLCIRIASVDPRPERQLDDLRGVVHYSGNSTERMLDHLRRVPGADLTKLITIEASCEDLEPGDVGVRARLCFVDGEHTRAAALRDARFCRQVVGEAGTIVFHDRRIVAPAIADFIADLTVAGAPYGAYPMPSELFVVELGRGRLPLTLIAVTRRSRCAIAAWRWLSRTPAAPAAIRGRLAVERCTRRLAALAVPVVKSLLAARSRRS